MKHDLEDLDINDYSNLIHFLYCVDYYQFEIDRDVYYKLISKLERNLDKLINKN